VKQELTLDGVTLENGSHIFTFGDATIIVKGKNRIGSIRTMEELAVNGNAPSQGIRCTGSLSITGDGSLVIYDMEQGITAETDITIEQSFTGSLTVYDSGTTYTPPPCCALAANNDVNIFGGTVTLYNDNTNGISAGNNVNITGGKVTVTGEQAIYAGNEFKIGSDVEIISMKDEKDGTGNDVEYSVDENGLVTNYDTAKYVKLSGAEEEDEPVCTYTTLIKAGEDQTLMLCGKEAGTFTIVKKGCGYQLINEAGQYIAFKDNQVVTQDEAYTWKYDGGLYAETKTTTYSRFLFWKYPTVKITKNYLAYKEDAYIISDICVEAKVQVNAEEHTWAYHHDGDGCHEAYCIYCGQEEEPEEHEYDNETGYCVCGKINPDLCYVSDVKVCKKKIDITTGFLFWAKKTTKYQYNICPVTENVCVKTVQYSGDEENWNNGTLLTSDIELSKFYIKVTDSYGHETNWVYDNGSVIPLN